MVDRGNDMYKLIQMSEGTGSNLRYDTRELTAVELAAIEKEAASSRRPTLQMSAPPESKKPEVAPVSVAPMTLRDTVYVSVAPESSRPPRQSSGLYIHVASRTKKR